MEGIKMNNYDKANEILKQYKQEHIIEFIDKSSSKVKDKLINQVLNIDFEELKGLYEKTFDDIYVDLEELEPIKAVNPKNIPTEEIDELKKIGKDIIRRNKFAVATMAGRTRNKTRT